jgi:phage baseplate assembly protein V
MIARIVAKLIGPIARRVRLIARRAVVTLVYDDPKMQELQLAIFSGEVRDHVERFEDYGFTSHPFPEAEALVLALGGSTNHCAVVKVADRRYRIRAIAPGEVALYDDQGQVIHLKRNKTLHVYGVDHLIADIAANAVLTCPEVTITATTKCQVNSPQVNLGGNRIELRRLVDERLIAIFNSHTHPGDSGGTTGAPNQALSTGNTCTDKTRAL